MDLKNPSLLLALSIVVVIVVTSYVYMGASSAATNALHDEFDMYIEAKVTVQPATKTPMATGVNSEAWSADPLSIDFGSPDAGKITKPIPVKVTNMMLIDDTRIHVRTDLAVPGIHLYVSESSSAFDYTKVDLSTTQPLKGITFNGPTGRGKTSTPGFAIMVDPSVPAGEYKFHIIICYSYCND